MNYALVAGYAIGAEIVSQVSRIMFLKFGRSIAGSTQKLEDLTTLGPSYVVSTIVAAITGVRGIFHFLDLLNAPVEVKMIGNRFDGPMDLTWVRACAGVEQTNYIFSAFLVQDLVHLVIQFPKLGGIEQILHHSVFLLCSFISGHFQINHFPFSWLIMGELSTVLLEARWFLRQMGRGDGPLIGFVNLSFAVIFGLTRVVIYGWGLVKMVLSSYVILEESSTTDLFRVLAMTNLVLVILGYGLNLFWFKKIVAMALRGGKPKKDQNKDV